MKHAKADLILSWFNFRSETAMQTVSDQRRNDTIENPVFTRGSGEELAEMFSSDLQKSKNRFDRLGKYLQIYTYLWASLILPVPYIFFTHPINIPYIYLTSTLPIPYHLASLVLKRGWWQTKYYTVHKNSFSFLYVGLLHEQGRKKRETLTETEPVSDFIPYSNPLTDFTGSILGNFKSFSLV